MRDAAAYKDEHLAQNRRPRFCVEGRRPQGLNQVLRRFLAGTLGA